MINSNKVRRQGQHSSPNKTKDKYLPHVDRSYTGKALGKNPLNSLLNGQKTEKPNSAVHQNGDMF